MGPPTAISTSRATFIPLCMTTAERTDNIISLSDGRSLGYAEYGKLEGFPVFYFHGGQESRLSSSFMNETAIDLGIRIISPDRPGVGLSSFQENRKFADWGKDVADLADMLSIRKFRVLGLSGGAPHVLACLHNIPERILGAAIVSGATPYNYKGSLKGMWFPVKLVHWFATRKRDKLLRKFIKNDFDSLSKKPEKRLKQFQKYLPKPDRDLLSKELQYAWDFINGSLESYRNGIDGVVQEWKLYVSDWGFPLSKIDKPVTLWFGTEDKMAPVNRGRYLENILPEAHLRIMENEGHFSLIRNHLKEILTDLLSRKPED